MTDLSSRVAIITGASRGIGRSIALALAKEKVDLVLVARDKAKLGVVEEIALREGIRCRTLEIDLMDTLSYQYIIKETLHEFGKIDFLINNAGSAISKPIIETTEKDWDELMMLNAKAPFFLCKEVIPELSKSNHPVIINVSSVVGRKGYINQAVYSATKHALTGFTKVLAVETQPLGIRVYLIAPGGVKTDMVTTMRPDIDIENLMKPEEVAEWVVFLLKQQGNTMIDELNLRRLNGTPW